MGDIGREVSFLFDKAFILLVGGQIQVHVVGTLVMYQLILRWGKGKLFVVADDLVDTLMNGVVEERES